MTAAVGLARPALPHLDSGRSFPGKAGRREGYDVFVGDVGETEFSGRPGGEGVLDRRRRGGGRRRVTWWIRCVDWEGCSRLVWKGEGLKVKGIFRHRRYEEDGETRSVREVIVEEPQSERHKGPGGGGMAGVSGVTGPSPRGGGPSLDRER